MARKRSLPAALMALPQALNEAVLKTLPEETIAALEPRQAAEIGAVIVSTSRAIAALLSPQPTTGGDDGR